MRLQVFAESDDPFPELFAHARRRAFHLETQDSYLVGDEDDSLRRFLAGEPALPPPASWRAWRELVRTSTERGVAVQRVRVVTEPHSDYVRWLIATTNAGDLGAYEDIRWMPRHLAEGGYTLDDWWLFDEDLLAYNLVDAGGNAAGVAVTEDPLTIAVCRSVRDRLWAGAVPHTDYIREHVSG
ncbi:hypothetical protein ABIA39_007458 [Nocardia sp. GAS34]|uniref:DUF6879 family protein n=1 Tax=unclassified Nocardia TaxID=2637762 RepID=UPI003D1B7D9D